MYFSVVGFRIGGLIDIITHKETGYLANPYDQESLAYGIKWVIEDMKEIKAFRKARLKAEKKWNSK